MLTPDRFLQPRGRLAPSLFTPEDGQAIDARLRTYIEVAQSQSVVAGIVDEAARDTAASHYVYFLAYTDIAQSFAEQPDDASLNDQGSESYSEKSVEFFERLAQQYLDLFAVATAPTEVGVVDLLPSGATVNVYRF